MMLLRYDENEVMVNFKPGDYSQYDVFLLVTQAYSDKVKKVHAKMVFSVTVKGHNKAAETDRLC